MLVINKIDVCRLSDLSPATRVLVDDIINSEGVQCIEVSCYSDEGVMDLKTKACDALLAHRVENKLKGNKINSVINRIHVALPKPRDDVERAPYIPDAVLNRKKFDRDDPDRRRLERDIEAEEGGAGVYVINMKSASLAVINFYLTISLFEQYRELPSQERRLEVRCHTGDMGGQECSRLC